MSKLLSAEFRRLFHSRIFQVAMIAAVISGIAGVCLVRKGENMNPLFGLPYLIYIYPALISLFLGTEYSNGTIRNKLVIGHKRKSIYFSKLIVCAVAGILIYFACAVSTAVFSGVLGRNLLINGNDGKMFLCCVLAIGVFLAITAIMVAISMSVQRKASAVMLCMVLIVWMSMWASMLMYDLEQPEYDYYPVYDTMADRESDEQAVNMKLQKNTAYVGGRKREVDEFLMNVLPGAQVLIAAFEMPTKECSIPLICISDVIWIGLSATIGIVVFQRKDLK